MKLISLRKTQLQNKISEAIQLGDQDHLLCLRSKLVHRYGIEALDDSEIGIKDLLELNPRGISHSSPSLEIDQTELPIESSFINSLDMPQESIKDEENLKNPDQKNVRELSDNENSVSAKVVENIEKIPLNAPNLPLVPAPPIPKLNSLRRWLPTSQEKMPKAS